MKIRNLFLLLSAAGLLACSCTKEYVTKQYYEETIVQGMDMTMIDYDISDSNWTLRDGYYEAILDVPEITSEIVEKGLVQVSRLYMDNGSKIWTPLPAMRVSVTTADDGSDFFFTTYTDFEWSLGTVNVFVTTTDLYTGDTPGDISLRVIISY